MSTTTYGVRPPRGTGKTGALAALCNKMMALAAVIALAMGIFMAPRPTWALDATQAAAAVKAGAAGKAYAKFAAACPASKCADSKAQAKAAAAYMQLGAACKAVLGVDTGVEDCRKAVVDTGPTTFVVDSAPVPDPAEAARLKAEKAERRRAERREREARERQAEREREAERERQAEREREAAPDAGMATAPAEVKPAVIEKSPDDKSGGLENALFRTLLGALVLYVAYRLVRRGAGEVKAHFSRVRALERDLGHPSEKIPADGPESPERVIRATGLHLRAERAENEVSRLSAELGQPSAAEDDEHEAIEASGLHADLEAAQSLTERYKTLVEGTAAVPAQDDQPAKAAVPGIRAKAAEAEKAKAAAERELAAKETECEALEARAKQLVAERDEARGVATRLEASYHESLTALKGAEADVLRDVVDSIDPASEIAAAKAVRS